MGEWQLDLPENISEYGIIGWELNGRPNYAPSVYFYCQKESTQSVRCLTLDVIWGTMVSLLNHATFLLLD